MKKKPWASNAHGLVDSGLKSDFLHRITYRNTLGIKTVVPAVQSENKVGEGTTHYFLRFVKTFDETSRILLHSISFRL